MKKHNRVLPSLAAFLLPLLVGTGVARAGAWEIDGVHSAANFSVRHMMVSNVRGDFSKLTGTLNIDDKDITKSSVEATIDVNSINTREPKRDAHLKGPDFFDAAQFPTLTFKSKKVESLGSGKLKVTGDLTIHGVTKPAVFDVELSPEVKDPMGNLKRGATATTKINRKDFGLSWNKTLETGGVIIGEEVAIIIDVELAKKK